MPVEEVRFDAVGFNSNEWFKDEDEDDLDGEEDLFNPSELQVEDLIVVESNLPINPIKDNSDAV